MSRRWVKYLRVPTSSAPIRRLYPSTSAAKIAMSLRSISPILVKTRPRTTPTSLLCARRGGHLEIRVLRALFLENDEVRFGSSAEVGPLAGYVRSTPDSRHRQVVSACPLSAMCGRPRVGKKKLHVADWVGAAMCSACRCGSHDRWP